MKLKITLKVKQKGQMLPLSYQYELSSWIYRLIYKGDNEFAKFLHSKGYDLKKMNFKLFTFSRLSVDDYKILDDRMRIFSDEVSFVASFFVDTAAHNMIKGLFQEEEFRLGDQITQVDFKVKRVETLTLSVQTDSVKLRTASPMIVAKKIQISEGRTATKYLHPVLDKEFGEYFSKNLTNKCLAAQNHGLLKGINLDEEIQFRLLTNKIKKDCIRIKAHTTSETKLIGYHLSFELKAPKELIELGMLAGFGTNNALGFGATRLLTEKKHSI